MRSQILKLAGVLKGCAAAVLESTKRAKGRPWLCSTQREKGHRRLRSAHARFTTEKVHHASDILLFMNISSINDSHVERFSLSLVFTSFWLYPNP